MEYKKQIIDDLTTGVPVREQIVGQRILGSKKFVSWVREKYIANEKGRERPDIQKIHRFLSMDAVLAIVEQETGDRRYYGGRLLHGQPSQKTSAG